MPDRPRGSRWRAGALLAVALVAASCSAGLDTKEAVRLGVIDHLSKRPELNISSMQVEVVSVSFREEEAQATVSFRPLGGAGGAGVQMQYHLTRKGRQWVVQGRTEAGANPHSTAADAPAPSGAGGALPPGHPRVDQPPATGKAK